LKLANVDMTDKETNETETVSETVTAALKWFNQPKGFGFVVPENEEQEIDAFLHITTLQRAEIQGLHDGARLVCEIERGPKGALVTNIVKLLDAGQPLAESTETDSTLKETTECYEISGNVKWYKQDKGFGFITPDDGMKDIFIHKTCLDRHGLEDLQAEQRITMIVKDVPKGREVISFSVSE
jgi:CspA family cold shock protein